MVRYALLLAGIVGGSIPVVAQSPTPVVVGENIVVTASLEGEEERRLPASVTVIEAEEIEARQSTEVSDLLGVVPGLNVVRSGSPGQVTSLFTRGTDSDSTLVLWNGVELNDPYFGGFNWAFLPTEGVDRLEVVRGPFSSLYGGDALGGVVQIFSADRDGGDVRLEGGSNGYLRGAVSAGTELGPVRFDVSGHLRRGDGQLENDFYDSEELMARFEWLVGPGMSLGVVARANDSKTGIPLSGGAPSPNREISWQERQVAVPFRAELGRWQVDARLSAVTYDSAFRDPDDAFGFTASDTQSESRRARAVASYALAPDRWVAFGSEYDRAEVTDSSVFGVSLAGESQHTWAMFGEVFHALGPVTLDLGVRYDDNNVFGSQTSPRLGALYAISERLRVRGSYGRAFRAPSIGELFYPITGNPDLQPEINDSVELAVDYEAGAWRVGITGFENRLENLIDFDFSTFRNVNVGRAETRGLELEAGYRTRLLALRWNATLLETEDLETGLPLLRRPERTSNLVATFYPEPFTVNATIRYVGERADVDPITFDRSVNPAYLRLDLAAEWQVTGRIAPYARIENVADEEYAEALGFPAPGRTLVGGLEVAF
jgi:TonB-dependent vitamin B12 receptor